MTDEIITHTKLIEGVTIALQYPYFWRDAMPKGWNFHDLAIQNIHSTGLASETWEGGAQDSIFVTIKGMDMREGMTWDEAIDELSSAWYDTPTDHPVQYCHTCCEQAQFEWVTFAKRCVECGAWEYDESEEYLLTEKPLEYWLNSGTTAQDLQEWEMYGPQEDGDWRD